MTSHELVIRFGRPFDVQTDRGFFVTGVREITVPFADRQSAEAALREVTVSVREVHDAGGEDYRTVIAGTVVRPGPELGGHVPALEPEEAPATMSPAVHVRSEHNASGYDTVSTAVLSPEGTLQVTARFAVIYGSDQAIGYQCTLIEARLNGALVTDPDRARRLAARAGIPEPAAMTWIDGRDA